MLELIFLCVGKHRFSLNSRVMSTMTCMPVRAAPYHWQRFLDAGRIRTCVFRELHPIALLRSLSRKVIWHTLRNLLVHRCEDNSITRISDLARLSYQIIPLNSRKKSCELKSESATFLFHEALSHQINEVVWRNHFDHRAKGKDSDQQLCLIVPFIS